MSICVSDDGKASHMFLGLLVAIDLDAIVFSVSFWDLLVRARKQGGTNE